MRKLISNKANAKIRTKHTEEELFGGIIVLDKVIKEEIPYRLREKLLEEVLEYINEPSEHELKDIEHVIKAIRDFPNSVYSEGWILRNNRGHQQEKE